MSFLDEARAAGEEGAKNAFGLLSRTSKPPPTWAHGRKVTISSMAQTTQQHAKEKPK
jgi:hypothetical protein